MRVGRGGREWLGAGQAKALILNWKKEAVTRRNSDMETSGIANFGIFLLLAFVVPGLCYMFVLGLCFPDWVCDKIHSFSGRARHPAAPAEGGFPASLIIGLAIVAGLLITSVTFSIEILLRNWSVFQSLYPSIPLREIAVAEASGKPVAHLQLVSAQPFMHLNLGLGILLILPIYIMAIILDHPGQKKKRWAIVFCLLVIGFANLVDASVLFHHATDAIAAVKQTPAPQSAERTPGKK
jgi:hypothetical protein